ncbi:outer membrane beta-barrel protein [Echinicola shivajiensis]|uniref:outer membrane beta-barrel protein n=1 Tax=Echinicola shivajiensis TaxID=1035916 RepID=UPI001BFCA1E5|nr:outer membrane beta-barrel protein [Echinicola shivajiensis]
MKRVFAIVIMFLLLSSSSFAQEGGIRLNLYGNFVFADKFDSYYDRGNGYFYSGRIEEGFQWGGGLEYMVNPIFGVELMYLRQDTNSPTRYRFVAGPEEFTNFDLAINYVLINPTRYFRTPGSPFEAYGGFQIGGVFANLTNPDNGRDDTATKLAVGLRGGGIYWASDYVGIKAQAQFISVVQSVGGGFYFGTGGSGVGVSSYSSIFQFGLGLGVALKLN